MLRLENLTKVYDDGTRALNDVSFAVPDGQFLIIIGLSGSGKSTLLRCVNRLIEPTDGRVVWNDVDVTAASQEELRTVNRSLDTKLGELAETNVSLYEANRLKSEFLGNVSHELRTPLTSIIGFAELLRDATEAPAKTSPDRINRFCNNILTSGRMLLDLINNLLQFFHRSFGCIYIARP